MIQDGVVWARHNRQLSVDIDVAKGMDEREMKGCWALAEVPDGPVV
jgi:hypothetical protein